MGSFNRFDGCIVLFHRGPFRTRFPGNFSPGSGRKAQGLQGLVKQKSEDLRRFQLIIYWKTRDELHWHSYFDQVLLPGTIMLGWIRALLELHGLLWFEPVYDRKGSAGAPSPGQCCISSRPRGSFVSWRDITAEKESRGEGLGPTMVLCDLWWYLTHHNYTSSLETHIFLFI